MSTKALMILSLIFIIIAGYFYASNDASLGKLNLKPSDIDYQASQVNALQTDQQGNINYRLKADSITHYQNAKIAVMTNPTILWRTANQKQIQLNAQQAQLDETSQMAQLSGKVLMTSQSADDASPAVIKLMGQDFVGNLNTKQVSSAKPINVMQGNNQFSAKQLTANVETGDYQFEQVSMTFAPPKN